MLRTSPIPVPYFSPGAVKNAVIVLLINAKNIRKEDVFRYGEV